MTDCDWPINLTLDLSSDVTGHIRHCFTILITFLLTTKQYQHVAYAHISIISLNNVIVVASFYLSTLNFLLSYQVQVKIGSLDRPETEEET